MEMKPLLPSKGSRRRERSKKEADELKIASFE
jgi:hypothetical protein